MNHTHRVLNIISPLALASCCVFGLGGVAGATEPVTSVYTEVAGAGGLRFEGVPDLDLMYLIEVGDMNSDGVDDLLFGFADNADYGAAVALGEIGDDGEISFVIEDLCPADNYDAIAAGDLDGDGVVEICLRQYGSPSMVIYSRIGIGNWGSEYIDLPFGEYSSGQVAFHDARTGIEAGDLDGDGLADLVMNASNSTVIIRWSSRPEGTEFQVYPVPQIGARNALYDMADYDGDGMLDVLIFDVDTERFVLLKGTGFDLVMFPEVIEVPVTGYGERGDLPYFGNFDGNGVVDLVLNNSADGTSVVVPDFVTGESEAVALSLGEGERVVGVPGDLDGSGADEILVVGVDADSHSTRIIDEPSLVFDALMAGSSQAVIEVGNLPITEVLLEESGGGPRVPMCVGLPLDGVGDEELLWMGKTRSYSVVSQEGFEILEIRSGASLRVSPWRDESDGLPSYGASQFEGQNVPLYMLPADVDGDGVDELIVVGQASRGKLVDVNDGVSTNIAGVNNAFMCAMADLGGDGEPEAVFSQVFNSLAVLSLNGDGTFAPRILFANPNGRDYRTLLVADFDADGKDDVMMYDMVANEYHLWRGTGDASAELWTVTNTIGPGADKADIIDLDGDAFPDLVGGGQFGIEFHQNNGDGTFTQIHSIDPQFTSYWIVAADVDGDGVTDLVVANRDAPTTIYFLDSNHDTELVLKLDHGGSFEEFEVIAADFDTNGLLDVVASSASQGINWYADVSSQHMVWTQTSARVFEPAGVLPASESSTVTASDFNGDGAVDIATASDWDNSVRVHWGTPASCGADLTGDGSLNFLDISEFLSSQVDFDGSGSFNFLDISAYLVAYGAGCP
tara:strand:- start:228152 stop:230698 length:2547 start_codon:yes stop_codon:yes gene_type:complete